MPRVFYDHGVNRPYYEGRSAYLSGQIRNPFWGTPGEERWSMGWDDERRECTEVVLKLRGVR